MVSSGGIKAKKKGDKIKSWREGQTDGRNNYKAGKRDGRIP